MVTKAVAGIIYNSVGTGSHGFSGFETLLRELHKHTYDEKKMHLIKAVVDSTASKCDPMCRAFAGSFSKACYIVDPEDKQGEGDFESRKERHVESGDCSYL